MMSILVYLADVPRRFDVGGKEQRRRTETGSF